MKHELLSDKLKLETLAAHRELEKFLVDRLRRMQDRNDYIKILQLFYTYFGALEDRISLFISSKELPDYLQRRKSESLVTDLASLDGIVPGKIPYANLPRINNTFEALGALYVMEGSTLGGVHICQLASKKLDIRDKGLLFFQSYGDRVDSMWESFKQALNLYSNNEVHANTVVTAANSTFKQFKLILEQSPA